MTKGIYPLADSNDAYSNDHGAPVLEETAGASRRFVIYWR
ncbi:MAG: hypothetical protein ACI9SB_001081 [Candidatus Azotimanducaceae bacterium]|jgi:hypothetical protein